MTIAPLLDALVQINETLAELCVLDIAMIHLDENLLDLGRGLHQRDRLRLEMGLRHVVPLARKIAKKGVPERRLAISAFQRGARAPSFRHTLNRLLRFQTEKKLDLAKLI